MREKNLSFDEDQVVIQDESYTSKTCTCSGSINKSLGGNKRFVCDACGLDIGRDVNGAMNIHFTQHNNVQNAMDAIPLAEMIRKTFG